MATDPLSELQDDLNLDDTNQSLSQLKLASIDDKNWPADEAPAFPKSGKYPASLGSGFWPKSSCLSCSFVVISTCTESLSSIKKLYRHIKLAPHPSESGSVLNSTKKCRASCCKYALVSPVPGYILVLTVQMCCKSLNVLHYGLLQES